MISFLKVFLSVDISYLFLSFTDNSGLVYWTSYQSQMGHLILKYVILVIIIMIISNNLNTVM